MDLYLGSVALIGFMIHSLMWYVVRIAYARRGGFHTLRDVETLRVSRPG